MKKYELNDMVKGWFVGSFSPAAFSTNACEVAVKRYQAGEYEARHHHKVATEITLILEGRVCMNEIEYLAGDIVVIDPLTSTDFRVLEAAITVVVKVPGASNDKYLGEV